VGDLCELSGGEPAKDSRGICDEALSLEPKDIGDGSAVRMSAASVYSISI